MSGVLFGVVLVLMLAPGCWVLPPRSMVLDYEGGENYSIRDALSCDMKERPLHFPG